MPDVQIIKLPNNIEIEAWYEPGREVVFVKVRRCPTGDMRDGKQGLKFATTLDGLFDIAEGQEYPMTRIHVGRKAEKGTLPSV